jgi:hypothetical protein
MAQRMEPRVLGAAVRIPAAICTWCQTYLTLVERTLAGRDGRGTRDRAPQQGHASRHSRSAFAATGNSGPFVCRRRLERANRAEPVGALAHVEFAAREFHICPPQATQFRRSQAGEDRSQQHGPVAPAAEKGDDGPYFGRRRNVHTGFEPVLRRRVGKTVLMGAAIADDVLRHQPPVMSVGKEA